MQNIRAAMLKTIVLPAIFRVCTCVCIHFFHNALGNDFTEPSGAPNLVKWICIQSVQRPPLKTILYMNFPKKIGSGQKWKHKKIPDEDNITTTIR